MGKHTLMCSAAPGPGRGRRTSHTKIFVSRPIYLATSATHLPVRGHPPALAGLTPTPSSGTPAHRAPEGPTGTHPHPKKHASTHPATHPPPPTTRVTGKNATTRSTAGLEKHGSTLSSTPRTSLTAHAFKGSRPSRVQDLQGFKTIKAPPVGMWLPIALAGFYAHHAPFEPHASLPPPTALAVFHTLSACARACVVGSSGGWWIGVCARWVWFLFPGPWSLVPGPWSLLPGCGSRVAGSWSLVLDCGSWVGVVGCGSAGR
jgi:hypothetical protein